MTVFETDRLVVKFFTEFDGDRFFSLNGDPEVMRYIRAAKSRKESDEFLRQVITEAYTFPHIGRWAVWQKNGDRFIGSFALIAVPSMPGKLQLGYSLLPAEWGKGYATELSIAGLQYFLKHHKHPEIFGVTKSPNIASQKVLLKAGFKFHSSTIENDKPLMIYIHRRSLTDDLS